MEWRRRRTETGDVKTYSRSRGVVMNGTCFLITRKMDFELLDH